MSRRPQRYKKLPSLWIAVDNLGRPHSDRSDGYEVKRPVRADIAGSL